jgi:glycosyltransferase involved in cell wall biosynthesis
MSVNENDKRRWVTISIVTATYNVARQLPGLIESLKAQTDKDFEWVVADGASTDGTLEMLQSVEGLNVVISSQPDFGIYDALNRAIKLATGNYYIVAGADDSFYGDAVANFRKSIEESGADIVSARAMHGNRCMKIKEGPSWLFGQFSFIASHTLATAIRKDLHLAYGYYSRLYPIAADQYFVVRACDGGASHRDGDFVAGMLGQAGVSSVDYIGNATEVFRVQVAMGRSIFIQTLLFLLRLLKTG